MKKTIKYILSIIVLMFAAGSSGHAIPLEDYTVREYTQTYVQPPVGTNLNGSGEDYISSPIEIGFTFHFDNQEYTKFRLSENGFILLGRADQTTFGGNYLTRYLDIHTPNAPLLAPFQFDMRVLTRKGYILEGTAPNRTLTCYWIGFDYWTLSTPNVQAEMYLKLYEGDAGKFEFVYGPNCTAVHVDLPNGASSNNAIISATHCVEGSPKRYINILPDLTASTYYYSNNTNRLVNQTTRAALVSGKTYVFNDQIQETGPVISYITPDIGTPGMSTYMEIIGPTGAFGNFIGSGGYNTSPYNDQFPTESCIEFLNPADTNKISFGPLTTSWGGRMIATQVFVNPDLPTPNSMHWNQLTDANIVQFRVRTTQGVTAWQKFYIVKPYNFNDLSNNTTDLVFGQGNLGIRSPRGCMIVDSLRLALATYTVSTTDCDPETPGNQGYLPFVLLSKGNITGQHTYYGSTDNFTTIDVSAVGANGGPGGGGGGGHFCDANYIGSYSRGSDGGNGFVSGGRGGLNNSSIPLIDNAWKSLGTSTGANGTSMNGILPPVDAWYECSGGGTGHPFGTSGKGSYVQDPTELNNAGGYGGGSGHTQATKGGGGGYATAGLQSNDFNAGRVNGNVTVVPIAGGSGGASGNPQGAGNCSGSGGGGGGAIRIAGNNISTLYIKADGANGGDGDNNSDGGGGSGGHIGIFAKGKVEQVRSSVLGGMTGNSGNRSGSGRIRIDATETGNGVVSYPSDAVSNFKAFTTDTTSWVKRNCTIEIYPNGRQNLTMYYKGASEKRWTFVLPSTADTPNAAERNLELNGQDSVYYVVVGSLDGTLNPGTAFPYRIDSCQYQTLPFFSQAATNILRIAKYPLVTGDTASFIDGGLHCFGKLTRDTITIKNEGEAPLILHLENAAFRDGVPGFEFEPKVETTVAVGDSMQIYTAYTMQYDVTGLVSDVLLIPNNDPEHTPWKVTCEASITAKSVDFVQNDEILEQIDFGTLCIGTANTTKQVTLRNNTVIDMILEHANFSAESLYFATISNPNLPANDTVNIEVTLTPSAQTGIFVDTLFLYTDDCDNYAAKLIVTANIDNSKLEFSENPLNFGEICEGEIVSRKITLRNPSDIDYDTHYLSANMPWISASYDADSTIKAHDSVSVTVSINTTGLADGLYTANLTFENLTCPQEHILEAMVTIQHATSDVASSYDFGYVQVGFSQTTDITLTNTGATPLYFDELPTVNPPFSVESSVPTLPTYVQPGEVIVFNVKYAPTESGDFSDSLIILSLGNGTACGQRKAVFLSGNASEPSVVLSTYSADFGLLANCEIQTDTIFLKNIGLYPVHIESAAITGTDASSFRVNTLVPYDLAPADSTAYMVTFDGNILPEGVKTATLEFTGSIELPKAELRGENETIHLTFEPETPINLGGIPVGESRTISVNLTNNGKLPINIHSINATGATVLPETMQLNSGETKALSVSFTMENAGNKTITVSCTISDPCGETRQVVINAVGLEGDVTYSPTTDFGVLAPCENIVQDFMITNSGDADVILNSAAISGTNADLFTITNAIDFPVTLAPTESQTISIEFSPEKVGDDGIKTADLTCNMTINHKSVDLVTSLRGERRTSLITPTGTITFDRTRVGNTSKSVLVLQNNGEGDVIISGTSPLTGTGAALFAINPAIAGITLPSGGSSQFEITFSPTEVGTYSASFMIYYSAKGCSDSLLVVLNGSCAPATIVHLRLPDIPEIDPAADYLNIPIYAYCENAEDGEVLSKISIDAEIDINGTVFLPKSITPSDHAMQNSITADTRKLTLQLRNMTITPEETVVATISGTPLLGNAKYSALTFSNISTENTVEISEITPHNGSLSFKICENGDDRLLDYSVPLSVKISPNPPSDNLINISVSTLEAGKHSLTIVNSLGQAVYTSDFIATREQKSGNSNTFEVQIETTDFPSGAYILRVEGPSTTAVQRLQIIK